MQRPTPCRFFLTGLVAALGGVVLLAQAGGANASRDLSDAAVARDVTAHVRQLGASGAFSGIVVAVRGTVPIVVATAGYADRAAKTRFTPSTHFTIGSMGKMFTATAVGQLVDARKLSFDDVVGKYLPDYPNATIRNKVTLGMLLSHTAGMGDFLARRTPSMMRDGVARADEFLRLYGRDEPAFEPGTRWSYSNAGLALAGAIVEKVSGEAYPDYIRAHVFRPAGMTNSDPNNIPHADPRLVVPYTKMTEQGPTGAWHEAPRDIGSPAGGAVSTAEDLVRFADALRGGRLVTVRTFRAMTTRHGAAPRGGGYGYAMEIAAESGETIVGHGGGFPGVSTHLYLVLDSPYTVVALANIDPPAAEQAAALARSLLIAKAAGGEQRTGAASPRHVRTGAGIRLVRIPAGSFEMGSNIRKAEQPVHRVTVGEFWLGATEVTQAQWQAIMGDNPSHFKLAGPDAPVEMVTWDAAQVFVQKLSEMDPDWTFRLPSEAEWEYACRAGGKAELYGPAREVAWIRENAGGTTHPVGQKRPNAFGLYDILGNVQEWVQDRWFEDHNGAPTDRSARTGGTSSSTRSRAAAGICRSSSSTPRCGIRSHPSIASASAWLRPRARRGLASRATLNETGRRAPGWNRRAANRSEADRDPPHPVAVVTAK